MDLNFSLHFWMECPPLSNPIWLIALSLSSNSLTASAGIKTPAMFSSDFSNLMVALLTDYKTFPLKSGKKILELSCTIFGFSDKEEGLFTFLTHLLFTFEKGLHDLFEFLFKGISLSFKQLVTLSGSRNFLFIELHVPTLVKRYILLAVICPLIFCLCYKYYTQSMIWNQSEYKLLRNK